MMCKTNPWKRRAAGLSGLELPSDTWKEYRKTSEEGSEVVLEPTEEVVRMVIPYRALTKVVELYVDGRMHQGDASTLAKRRMVV